MGGWSDSAPVGARFRARSAPRRRYAPSNTPVITIADSGHDFAFRRSVLLAGTLEWRYQFAPDDGATHVTESYTVIKPTTTFGWFIVGTVYGETGRKAALRTDIQETLLRIKAAAESCGSAAAT